MTSGIVIESEFRPALIAKLQAAIDPQARVWTSSTGIKLKLKPVSVGLMNRIQSDQTGKPQVPTTHVNYGTKEAPEWGIEPNPDDPTYKEARELWQSAMSQRVATFIYAMGVDIEVPDQFKNDVKLWHSDATETDLKYYYITAIIPPSEYEALTNAILGQTAPTEAGIADATAGFPSVGERSGN